MKKITQRLNFRPALFAAMGVIMGVVIYFHCRFRAFVVTDVLFLLVFLPLFYRRPIAFWRVVAALFLFVCSCGLGALSAHVKTQSYLNRAEEGSYTVVGTVVSAAYGVYTSEFTFSSLTFDGKEVKGKLSADLWSDQIRVGDILELRGEVSLPHLPASTKTDGSYEFVNDVRYLLSAEEYAIVGKSSNPFYLLNAKLFSLLHDGMEVDEANVAYALLTGNGRNMDAGLSDATRRGGIAHIFAVSGLHIGILFSAVYALAGKLKKFRLIPALLLATGYCALCSFTVSSVRALIMCAVGGGIRTFGMKYDFPEGIGLAAFSVLLFFPAEWLSVGFRLSFGAVAGLALFSGSIQRALKKLPSFLAAYLAASVSVQLFTFPTLIESFSYWSVWGMLLNFFLIPILPVLFLGLFLCVVLALILPFTATFVLSMASGMFSALILLFGAADFSLVLTGFSLGAGAIAWYVACLFLSERVRMAPVARAIVAGISVIIVSACIVLRNAVFVGCKIIGTENAVFVQTNESRVLIIDEDLSLYGCEKFLSHTYGGRLDAVVVLSDTLMPNVNTAAFLDTDLIYVFALQEETGLRKTPVFPAVAFDVGEVHCRFTGSSSLSVSTEDGTFFIDFEESTRFEGELLFGNDCDGLIFYLRHGIIKQI